MADRDRWIVAKDGSLIAVRNIEHIALSNFAIMCTCVSGETYTIGRYGSTDTAKHAYADLCYTLLSE